MFEEYVKIERLKSQIIDNIKILLDVNKEDKKNEMIGNLTMLSNGRKLLEKWKENHSYYRSKRNGGK